MRIRLTAAAVAVTAISLFGATAASAQIAIPLKREAPSWYTPQLNARVLAAGADGVQVGAERANDECPGYAARGVSAAGCIVAPYGCTANFVFADRRSRYIGTARHCVNKIGEAVVMQVSTSTLAAVGTVVKMTSGDGDPGNDFALIRLFPDVVAKWGLRPAIPVIGGPTGVYTGCAVQTVKYFGHGYYTSVAQGKPEGGLATNWLTSGFGWTGVGLNGDSGSPVVLGDNRAAGNFTHIVINGKSYPGSTFVGTRITAILAFVGRKVRLVQANGSPVTSGPATCTSSGLSGGGGRTDAAPDATTGIPVVDEAVDDVVDDVVGDVLGDDEDDQDEDGKGEDGGKDDDRDGGGLLGALGL